MELLFYWLIASLNLFTMAHSSLLKSAWKMEATQHLSDSVAIADGLLELQGQAAAEEERRRLHEWRRLTVCPSFVKGATFNEIGVASCSLAVTTTVNNGEELRIRGQPLLSHPALDRGGQGDGLNMMTSRHFLLTGTGRLTLINLELTGAFVGQLNVNDPNNCGYCRKAKCICNCLCGSSCSYGVCGGCADVSACASNHEGGALRMEGSSIAILIDITFGSNTAVAGPNIFQVERSIHPFFTLTKLYIMRMPTYQNVAQAASIYSCDAAPTTFCSEYYNTECELDTTTGRWANGGLVGHVVCACAELSGGTCSVCASASATGCTTVLCDANFFDTDTIASNGCEATCAVVPGGTCTVCTTASASGCTALSCDANFFDTDSCDCNGCEDGCPDVVDGVCSSCSDKDTCVTTVCDSFRFDVDGNKISCEQGCPVKAHGVCTECSDETTCTQITCDQGYEDVNNDATDGCESASLCIIGTLGIEGTIACVNNGVPSGVSESCACSCAIGFSGTFCEVADMCATGVTAGCTCADSLSHVKERASALETERNSLQVEKNTLTSEKTTLENERDVLVGEKTTLTSEKITLENERDVLIRENATLTLEKTTLENEKNVLIEEKTTLTLEKTTLENERDVLIETRTMLENKRDSLLEDKTKLTSEKTTLENEHDSLLEDKTTLEAEIAEIAKTNTNEATSPAATDTSSSTNTAVTEGTEIEQRKDEMIMVLAGLLFFCLAVSTVLCFCRLTRKKPIVVAIVPQTAAPKHIGKFGQFMDRNHDAIQKIGHHDHAVSVQKLSRVHSRRKVEKIQKNQFHAKGRLMARLKKRAEVSHAATKVNKVVGTGSSTLILPEALISEEEQQKKAEKKLEKQQRKAEKKAQKRASKIAAKKQKKKRKNNLKKEEEENVEEDVVVKVLEESMAPKRSYSEV